MHCSRTFSSTNRLPRVVSFWVWTCIGWLSVHGLAHWAKIFGAFDCKLDSVLESVTVRLDLHTSTTYFNRVQFFPVQSIYISDVLHPRAHLAKITLGHRSFHATTAVMPANNNVLHSQVLDCILKHAGMCDAPNPQQATAQPMPEKITIQNKQMSNGVLYFMLLNE